MTTKPSANGTGFDRRAIPAAAHESVWHAPDGYPIRRIDWPELAQEPEQACRGSLLFLPGRADFPEKYLETLDGWSRAGWLVTSTDWRGQGCSGRLGTDSRTGHIDDFGLWIDDLCAFWNEWKSTTAPPHVIVGHSMGGHLVLRALAEKKIAPDAAVLIAPMLGLIPRLLPMPIAHILVRLMARIGNPARPAWRGSEKPGKLPEDRFDLLTHDADRYADELWWRRNRTELSMAAPSWGWIERGIASMRLLRRPGVLEAVDRPVLFVATRHDGLVDPHAIAKAAARMKQAAQDQRHAEHNENENQASQAVDVLCRFLVQQGP